MSKTKAQLENQVEELQALLKEAGEEIDSLDARLESGSGEAEEIPEHGHSRHESREQRQNRLRSRHMRDELKTLSA